MLPRLILGVDPGFRGGLAIYDPVSNDLKALLPTPTITVKERLELDLPILSMFVDKWAAKLQFAAIERVSARPGQGVTSMFRFGHATGLITGMLAGSNIPTHHIPPAIWKLSMGLSHDKNLSRAKAQSLFPHYKDAFKRVKDDGVAEAALIAVFAKRLWRNTH